jgi:hypothetical protein
MSQARCVYLSQSTIVDGGSTIHNRFVAGTDFYPSANSLELDASEWYTRISLDLPVIPKHYKSPCATPHQESNDESDVTLR